MGGGKGDGKGGCADYSKTECEAQDQLPCSWDDGKCAMKKKPTEEVCVEEMKACAANEKCSMIHEKLQAAMKKEGGYGGKGGDGKYDDKKEGGYGGDKKEGGKEDGEKKEYPPKKEGGEGGYGGDKKEGGKEDGEKKEYPPKKEGGYGGDKKEGSEKKEYPPKKEGGYGGDKQGYSGYGKQGKSGRQLHQHLLSEKGGEKKE